MATLEVDNHIEMVEYIEETEVESVYYNEESNTITSIADNEI